VPDLEFDDVQNKAAHIAHQEGLLEDEDIGPADIELYGRIVEWWKLSRVGYKPRHLSLFEWKLVAHIDFWWKLREYEVLESQMKAFTI